LATANGSLEETRYFLLLSRDLGYVAKERYEELERECTSVAQMIAALGRSLKSRLAGGSRITGHGPRTTIRNG
jgi:four helix bundle protein